jgi:hypothetical protein
MGTAHAEVRQSEAPNAEDAEDAEERGG